MNFRFLLLILSGFNLFFANSLICSVTVDYIVVGVGNSGAVVAKILSDDKKTSVIALHNGKNLNQDPIVKLSKNAVFTVPSAIIGPPLFENGETVPQPFVNDREILWAIALPEGGASSINASAFARGTNQAYSKWEAIGGSPWSVKHILKIFKKIETYHGNTTDPLNRGYCGPLSVRQVLPPKAVSTKFAEAVICRNRVPLCSRL